MNRGFATPYVKRQNGVIMTQIEKKLRIGGYAHNKYREIRRKIRQWFDEN